MGGFRAGLGLASRLVSGRFCVDVFVDLGRV